MINVVKERYKSDIEKDGEDELVLQLKNLRTELSKKYNLYPVYNIFNNETLTLIIEHKPSTLEDLVNIKGLGSKKAEIFGAEIIDFVNSKLIKKTKPTFEVDQKLLELLLVERSKIAKFNKLTEDDVYTNNVAGFKAKMKPKDRETLSKVYGFRKENIDVFGDYLLKVISKYLETTK
jgi:restriction system protein